MRHHIKALQEYEESHDAFGKLCEFVAVKNSNLIKHFCDGSAHLPSFILIKKLRSKFIDLVEEDEELKTLFNSAIDCSKLFYLRTLVIIKATNNGQGAKFDKKFAKEIHPLGQQLTNLLINIKHRIKLVRVQRQKTNNSVISKCRNKINCLLSPLIVLAGNLIYKITLLQSSHHNLAKKLYYFTILATASVFITTDLLFFDDISFPLATAINTILCLTITILTVVAYPASNFGKIDINGRNVVAYKYKVFFNNLSNKKIYNIFAMQNSNGYRQKLPETIESPELSTLIETKEIRP